MTEDGGQRERMYAIDRTVKDVWRIAQAVDEGAVAAQGKFRDGNSCLLRSG